MVFGLFFYSSQRPSQIGPTADFDGAAIPPLIFSMAQPMRLKAFSVLLLFFLQLWGTDHHPDHVEAACRKSLADLNIEYFDSYLVHWPTAFPVSILG